MALTAAEKQRRYRERQKLRAAGLLEEQNRPEPLEIPRAITLSEFVKGQGDESVEAFDWMAEQLNLPVGQFHTDQHKEQEIEWTHNIIRDMEIALATITTTLSGYWTDQIDREIERLRASELADPGREEQALEKIVRYAAMRKSLNKTYRLSLQNYEPEEN
jgi:hypothetical protein